MMFIDDDDDDGIDDAVSAPVFRINTVSGSPFKTDSALHSAAKLEHKEPAKTNSQSLHRKVLPNLKCTTEHIGKGQNDRRSVTYNNIPRNETRWNKFAY